MHNFQGSWLTAPEFAGLKPLNVFHREHEPAVCDLKKEHPAELRNYRMLVEGTFTCAPSEGNVFVEIAADDYYKLYINGRFAAQGSTPGYYFDTNWNRVDVTPYLCDGVNSIAVDVYYQGLINRVWNSGDLRMGTVFDVVQQTGDGRKLLRSSDGTFTCRRLAAFSPDDPTTGYETQYLERVDLRKSDPLPQPCVVLSDPDYTFADEPAELIQVYETSAVKREILPAKDGFPGGVFYDFGSEIAAFLRIRVKGAKDGANVTLYCGEEQDDSPLRTRYQMRCNCNYMDTVTFKAGDSEYMQYDYKAFRYVTVVSEGCEKVTVTAMVRHHPFRENGGILKTNDPVLQQVFDLCRRTIRNGCQEIYMDCPSREKGQYAGDSTVTSTSQLWLTGDPTMLRRCMKTQMESSFVDVGLLAVAPGSFMQEIADYSLQFPILALHHYEATGDRDFLAECFEHCRNIVSWFRRYEREDGLLDGVKGKWNLVDWPENLRDNYDFELTKPIGDGVHNVINAFYVGCVLQTEEIAAILGKPFEKRGDILKEAFNRVFFDDRLGLYVDSEGSCHASLHANALPAFYGLLPENASRTVCDLIVAKGFCCGVYMSYFVLKALCRYQRYGDAYRLVTGDSIHSWVNMLQEGATTTFEAWGKDQKWNTSFCHPWATSPIPVILEDFLGLRLDGKRGESHLPDGVTAKYIR